MNNPARRHGSQTEWIVLLFTIIGLLLLPSRVRHFSVRTIAQPLVIQTSKTSPPRLAFHETMNRNESAPAEPAAEEPAARVDLNEMMAKPSAVRGLKAIQSKKVILNPMQVPREGAVQMIKDQAWVEELPAGQKKRMDLANAKDQVLDQDWKLPTLADLFEDKIRAIKSKLEPTRKPKVYVAATDSQGRTRTPEDVQENVGVEVNRSVASEEARSTSENSRHLVTGALTVTADAAIGPGRHLEVRWFDEGIAKEAGQINLDPKNVTYSIWIPDLSGTVIARVLDDNGTEVGSGAFRVSQMDTSDRLRNASITVQPRSRVARYAQNFYDQDNSSKMMAASRSRRNPDPEVLVSAFAEEIKTDGDGTLIADGISEGSWTFLRTQKKGFYPSLHLVSAGVEKVMPLFPESMMRALIEIVRDSQGPELASKGNGSVLWGQVVRSSAGTSGMTIELEGYPDLRPVYFNDLLIPDQKAKTTSKNGYFAFVDLPEGFYSLRVMQGNLQKGIANVEVDADSVSPIQIATDALTEKIPVKVFDGFTGTPGLAQVEFQHLPEALDVNGFAQVSVPQEESLSLVKVAPKDDFYMNSIHVLSSHQDHLHLPMVRRDWISSFKGAAKISDAPDSGTILGFVPSDEYELELPHLRGGPAVTVVYFDAQGMLAPKPVAGGGFIVFNAPSGSHTISVLPKNAGSLHSMVIPVDSGTLNILKFDF